MTDIVISYGREDQGSALSLCQWLRGQGRRVWWDDDILPGTDFRDAIVEAINRAKVVVVIWSNAAAASNYVRDEASLAVRQQKLIATHLVEFNVQNIPLGFRGLNSRAITDRDYILQAIDARLEGNELNESYPQTDNSDEASQAAADDYWFTNDVRQKSSCAVFSANATANHFWTAKNEIISLFPSKLRQAGFSIGDYEISGDSSPSHELYRHWSYTFPISRLGRGKGNWGKQAITLHFDIYRDLKNNTAWPHKDQAILIAAYSPSVADAWEVEGLKVRDDGKVGAWDAEWKGEYGSLLPVNENSTILAWDGDEDEGSWTRRGWLFGLPLRRIRSPGILTSDVVSPLLRMLNDGLPARIPNAIEWPSQKNTK